MKKKALALLLAAAMAIQPLSVAGAAEFTDGQQMDVEPVEVFTDDAAEEPVVAVEKAEEGSVAPSETAIQMGDDVWVVFDDTTNTATISGTGDMWDYLSDGWDATKTYLNPFVTTHKNVKNLIVENGVNSIGDYLCYYSAIEKITLGNSVKRIGNRSFFGCKFSEIILPDSITQIGEYSFANCTRLENIKLSKGLSSLSKYAFNYCIKLKAVDIPETVKSIEYGVFNYCSNLEEVELCEGLEEIQSGAFSNCINLIRIKLPKSLKILGDSIFRYCTRLEEIAFQDGFLVNIPHLTFGDCNNLSFIELPEGITEIGAQAFECCFNLKEVTIPSSINKISDSAFDDCKYLTIKGYTGSIAEQYAKNHRINFISIGEMPSIAPILTKDSVEWTSYNSARVACTSNKDGCYYADWVTRDSNPPIFDFEQQGIPVTANRKFIVNLYDLSADDLIDIYVCVKDTHGNISENLVFCLDENQRPQKPPIKIQVGDNVYATVNGSVLTLTGSGDTYDYKEYQDWYNANKSNIKHVIFDGKITRIGDYFFKDFKGLEKIAFPEGITELGKDVLTGCSGLKEIHFPSTLKVIPCFGDAMDENGFPNLETVVIPEGVSTIGEYAFVGCPKLISITLPDSITNLELSSFAYTGITELDLPEKITKIPSHFLDSSAIENIILPESVTEIGYSAFEKCSNLEEIFIPQNVAYIAKNVLGDCRNAYIKGYKDSVAERYALANAIPFVSVDYKVVFKEDGRTIGKPQYIPKNGNATPPPLTPRPGYTLSWDADYTNITEDMVINAVWTKDGADKPEPPIIVYPPSETKYTVTFKDRGKVIKTEKVVSGEAADFPYVSRYGYELSWDKDFSKVTSNMTVNAVWTVIKPVKVTSMTAEVLPKYARLSWDETEFTSYYLVYRKAAADKEFKQVAKTTRVLWNDKKVKPGNEYQYKVAAVRSVEGKKYQGEYSDTVTVKIGKPETGDIYSVGKLNYKIMNSNEVRVIGLAKNIASLSIPTAVSISGKPYKVTSIDHKAFYRNENLVDVKIGNNVNYIGKYSFYQCPNLESVKFGGRVQTISTCAFTQCPKLGNVVLPSSVERLGAKAFFKCTSMRIMTVKTSKLNYLGTKAFAINPKITIRVPKSKYSAYVKMIKKSGKYAATKFQKF